MESHWIEWAFSPELPAQGILNNGSWTSLVLLFLFQFPKTESTCWIGSVGAEGDSGCEVDAASEHLSSVGEAGRSVQAIDGDKECVGRNQATPRTLAPFRPHLTRATCTRLFDQNGSEEPQSPPMYLTEVPTKGECCDSSLSYLLCSPSPILPWQAVPCCRRDSGEAGESQSFATSWISCQRELLQLKLFAKHSTVCLTLLKWFQWLVLDNRDWCIIQTNTFDQASTPGLI